MKLQFTNGYRPRFDQISRILQYLLTQENRKKIPRKDIVDALGIPDKQIENLTSMMVGFGLVYPRSTIPTLFGKAIIQRDPYFEKPETLWIIHFTVSCNPEWVVWYRIINKVLREQEKYSVDTISETYFPDLDVHFSERSIKEKLPKEVGAVLAAYSRSELANLRIIASDKTGSFCKSDPIEIPSLAFLFCILVYRDVYSPGSSAINTTELSQADNSPGRVLALEDYQVRQILGNLHDAGIIRLEKQANLDQVRLSDNLCQGNILAKIYGGCDGN